MSQAETTPQDRETTAVNLERVTFRIPKAQLERLDALVDRGAFPNRSEAIRAAVGQLVAEENAGDGDA